MTGDGGAQVPARAPGSIPAVKRILTGLGAAVAALLAGASVSACGVAPRAATVGSQTVTVSQLNATMHSLTTSTAGRCLLALQNPQLLGFSGVGAGGSGTYATAFASSVLSNLVGNALAVDYADQAGATVSAADRSAASQQYAKILDGEIQANIQSAGQKGGSPCVGPTGVPLTGTSLLAQLPAGVRSAQVNAQAVDASLLTHGVDLSDQAVLAYYVANRDSFTTVCVSVIASANQADADIVSNKLHKGASFADLATSSSVDKTTGAQGGQLGCTFTAGRIKSALQLTSLTPGEPITPIKTSSGIWAVYEVTSTSEQPVTSVASLIRSQIVRGTANVQRVSRNLIDYSRKTTITINPQYGTWRRLRVVPPPAPPQQFLAPTTTGASGGGASSGGSTPSTAPTSPN